MNKTICIGIIACIALFLVGCSTTQPVTTSTQPEQTPNAAPIIQAGTHTIEIRDFSYVPKELTIKKGDTVIWTNSDSAKHTVTSDNGNELDSSLLPTGGEYSHTFEQKGTFDYHCAPHPSMKATIIVE